MPPLNNLTKLTDFSIANNRFTFDGMENLPKTTGPGYYAYGQQANIPINRHGNVLAVSAGGTLSNNTYKWYKNNIFVTTKTGDSTFTQTGSATYSIIVTNALATALTLHSDNYLLPLNLLSFNATQQKNTALLQWQTVNELNTKEFVIERAPDAIHFTAIGTVAAHNTNGANRYSFIDNQLPGNVVYYRLLMTDKDGAFAYSNIVEVRPDGFNASFTVLPNPVQTITTIAFNSNGGQYALQVCDAAGKIVKQVTGTAIIGSNNVPLDMRRYAAGAYVITLVTADNKKQTQIMIKQ